MEINISIIISKIVMVVERMYMVIDVLVWELNVLK